MSTLPTPAAAFTREHGCSEAEWLMWLPAAVHGHRLEQPGAQQARVLLEGTGILALHWEPLPPRRIALLTLPRLLVHYRFDGASDEQRARFMKRFDLHIQRGGG